MADPRGSAERAFILDPRYAQRLHQACPDLEDWPRSWHVEPADILVGQQIVQVLMPFLLHLLHLLDQGLTKASFGRHRDNLWTLSSELIRCRYDDDELAKPHVKNALRQLTGPQAVARPRSLKQSQALEAGTHNVVDQASVEKSHSSEVTGTRVHHWATVEAANGFERQTWQLQSASRHSHHIPRRASSLRRRAWQTR